MKRLHIVGKSKDNRRLYLARAKDAKFGSFEIPISAKLLKLLREAEDAKSPSGRGKRASSVAAPGPDPEEASASESSEAPREAAASRADGRRSSTPRTAGRPTGPSPGSEGGPTAAEGVGRRRPAAASAGKGRTVSAPAATRRAASDAKSARDPKAAGTPDRAAAESATDDVGSVRVVRRTPPAKSASAADAVDVPLAPRRRKAESETAPSEEAARKPVPPKKRTATKRAGSKDAGSTSRRRSAATRPEANRERSPITARTKRPEIPARSKLSPAEIQSLIRAGRTPRTVAQMAGTQIAWVKWLAEPVQQERMAIVGQALGQRQTRARLGASAEPLGTAVALNLRSRGISGADRVVEDGFTAVRPNGRTWRLRLSFEHRGRRTSAVWTYDPQRRELTPVNTLASQLGWRRPRATPAGDGAADGDGGAPARTTRRTTAKSRTTRTSGARRKATARSSASSRSTSRRRSS